MKRDPALVPLSREHHHGLVMAARIEKELPDLDAVGIGALYEDLIAFWAAGLLPHFRAENECLLTRLTRYVEPGDELIRRTQLDHLGMEALVATMRDTRDVDVRRGALRRFGEWLRTHIRWEEDVLFREAQRLMSADDLGATGRDISDRLPSTPVVPPLPRASG